MSRGRSFTLHFALAVVSVAALAACGPSPAQQVPMPSVCDSASPPPECTTACDPARGSLDCPRGYHCTEAGRCDAQCGVGGATCGSGHRCTSDGYCLPDHVPAPDASCPSIQFAAKHVTPSIELLVDRSTSMLDEIDAAATVSKYDAVRAALVDPASGVVTRLQSKAYFGASLYTHLDTPCPELKSVGRALGNRAAVANLIDTWRPMGATPTGPSIEAVTASFAGSPPPAGSPRFIVLATDGLPNACPGDAIDPRARAVAATQAAFTANIRTFVLAVGIAIPAAHLQDIANAGAGHANAPYFLATTPQQLVARFEEIIGGIVSCELEIDGTVDPAQAASGVVRLNGSPLAYGRDWMLVDPSRIRLVGAACTALKSTPNATVDATFPCGAVIL